MSNNFIHFEKKNRTDKHANWTLFWGFAALFTLGITGIFAIIEFIRAKKEIYFMPVRAYIGLILGILGIVGWGAYVVYLLMFA